MRITYFGHSAFRIETGSSTILLDPFLSGNPHYKGDVEGASAGATHIVLTHGHSDHIGDTLAIAQATGAKVVGTFELATWLKAKGAPAVEPMNTGGTVKFGDFSVTLTQAFHSASFAEENGVPIYLGMPNGVIFHFNDAPTLYAMGDTDIFSDMALINELHRPKIGLVPVGDRFTMGGAVAALACRRYFDFDMVIPIHWGTMPILDASPQTFVEAMEEEGGKVRVPVIGQGFEV
ncbi:metal-dependent hydrolase [Consotaella salsifontis]|uniref:UPF0173 metal-dependent hydrolase SAMN05428963_101311 n=1 Tax=Consotaella salsifontis TaxID=1365950 RepID=A0A1T4LPB1_9HYPH|nr:metal-dependent hydrolase [Consotaella salsifontis]SJZ56579.1 L-ascorbate metabolism protein UlaG, beta-lactamase superfamily [Consotaella salsifontis]